MRQPRVRRGSWPAVVGGGLAAATVVAASVVAVLIAQARPGPAPGPDGYGGTGSPLLRGVTGGPPPGGKQSEQSRAVTLNLPALSGSMPGQPPTTQPTATRPATTQPARTQPPASSPATPGPGQQSAAGPAVPRLVVPDVIAAKAGGVTPADLAKLRRLSKVRAVLPIAGARITVNGRQLTVLGAPASELRPWTPPETAVSQRVWAEFAAGDLITTARAARALGLAGGNQYPVEAAARTRVRFGTQALLGVAGVDAIVNMKRARQFGLVSDVAVLVNAPAATMNTLVAQVKAALGASSQVVRLVPVQVSTSLPVDKNPPTGRPANYLALFQESAAQYCPGLSWTVLAAIGQIESADGTNMGPSTAGALGPMQFLPATWRIWGITGFGDTAPPDIMNPFDAVPSAARLLCADGAAAGGQALRQAIFDYNHAGWYVDEVLSLADEYAREFG